MKTGTDFSSQYPDPWKRHLAASRSKLLAALPLLWVLFSATILAASGPWGERKQISIPRVDQSPILEDFLDMRPSPQWEGQLAEFHDFIQRAPSDGEPATQHTDVYMGYDDKNLYVIFVAFDSNRKGVRARMTTRDQLTDDERLDVFLDTFHDQRHAFVFTCNPLGIQQDGRWDESAISQYDSSFDTVWHSRGQLTDQGFVVLMAIPFKSLRFPPGAEQTWGILFIRWIQRNNESDSWPWVSTRVEGRLSQEATLTGLKDISPGRNVQLIPYGFARSYRALDERDPNQPHFVTNNFSPDGGLDGKVVIKDSLVLDATVNPDFSQVESDQPQVTVNQRFEVFFPEKRPFFLENASFFDTPINLFFSRRVADPQFGVRLTGKKGPYALGALVADDESPGKITPANNPNAGKRAHYSIVRVNRDLFRQSTLGIMVADREFAGSFNRVGGLDGRFKLTKNLVANFQGVASSTTQLDGTTLAGPAYKARLRQTGLKFSYNLDYDDFSPGFRNESGFLAANTVDRFMVRTRSIPKPPLRTDERSLGQFVTYRFRPEGKVLISWGPTFFFNPVWDHSGTRLDTYYDYGLTGELTGQTNIEVYQTADREVLRPQDFPVLPQKRSYFHSRDGFFIRSRYFPKVNFQAEYARGTAINFVPSAGQAPTLANLTRANLGVTLRPLTPLLIDNTYILERLTDRGVGASIFNNHIVRSKWNWQFTREFSLRVILQYTTVLANSSFTSLQTTKNFNGDFLLTYLVTPGTALYVGYNGNLQNVNLLAGATTSQIVRTNDFLNDGNQFFVKFSYLFRF